LKTILLLQPCPFCKSKETEVHKINSGSRIFFIGCNECNACGPEGKTLTQAQQAWNQRSKKKEKNNG